MGQNFLTDGNLAQKLVDLSRIEEGQPVLEIGPGMGMITRKILEAGGKLTAVELDAKLATHVRQFFGKQVKLVEGDAVDFPAGAIQEFDQLAVVANPPFAITGPWLAKLLDLGFPKIMGLLLQKEAVERISASSGSKKYGPLSMRIEAAYRQIAQHPVPPASFFPPPTIDSQMVVFERVEEPKKFCTEFLKLVQELFTQRRKQVGGMLKKRLAEEQLIQWEQVLKGNKLSFQSRPEQIPTSVWIELSES